MRYIRGYRVIDVPTGLGAVTHAFYVKEHNQPASSSSSSEKGRTMFVGNVDYVRDRSLEELDGILRDLFGVFGEVTSVSVSQLAPDEDEDDDEEGGAADDLKRLFRPTPTTYSFGNADAICGSVPCPTMTTTDQTLPPSREPPTVSPGSPQKTACSPRTWPWSRPRDGPAWPPAVVPRRAVVGQRSMRLRRVLRMWCSEIRAL